MKCENFRCTPDRCETEMDCAEGEECEVAFGSCPERSCSSNPDCGPDDCCNTLTGYCVPAEICDRYEKGIPADCQAQAELCDRQDNDCDASIDEDFPLLGTQCSVGTGVCLRIGHYICSEDRQGVVCDVIPGPSDPEVCDGVDNNCDGVTDENC